jgi:diketogulonate reductase-like aldo/keto reductase
MELREISSGVRIPVIGLGTWGIGGRETEDRDRDKDAVTAIRVALELGMTHIDTAEHYGAGHSEELVGQAIESFDRDKLFITTKVWPNHLKRRDLLSSIRASLGRLQLDRIDLYLVHWPNPEIPLQETMGAMEECVKEGYTRFIGVSNFSTQLMEKAQALLKESKLVANQVEYSLIDQKPRMELLPACRGMDVSLVAYRPLGRGSLIEQANSVLDEIAKEHGKTRTQVALNWLIRQDGVFTIPKSANPVHLMEIVGAVGWRLTEEESIRLSRAFI